MLESHKIIVFMGQKWLNIVISYGSTLYVRLLYITNALKPVRKKNDRKKREIVKSLHLGSTVTFTTII